MNYFSQEERAKLVRQNKAAIQENKKADNEVMKNEIASSG